MDIFYTVHMFTIMVERFTGDGSGAFGRVLQGLLRPLIRAMIAQGMTAPALYRIIKRLYVEVAEQDFKLPTERQTDSRISMLTGVHRRDVRDFRGSDPTADDAAKEKVTTIASVLGHWMANPDARGADGRPTPLPRSGDAGLNFESLVRMVSKDIRPRTVLDELLRQDLVHVEDGVVHLKTDAFLGPADPDQRVHFFAENVGDHIAAAVDNLLADDPRFMERAVFYNRLTSGSVDQIEEQARDKASTILQTVNEMANDLQAQDLDNQDGTQRFRFGVFFYREDEAGDGASNHLENQEDDGDGDDAKS
ncbi:MAG: DUF6502 family protein [Pseudomonadota bacterium]